MQIIIFLATLAFSGERVQPGNYNVKQESYVFTVEEANSLRIEIETLQAEIRKRDEIIEKYKELELVMSKKDEARQEEITIRDQQIVDYKQWLRVEQERISSLEKREKARRWEKWGFLLLGVGLTTGSVLLADQIDDFIDKN